jgi:hypothetical protein
MKRETPEQCLTRIVELCVPIPDSASVYVPKLEIALARMALMPEKTEVEYFNCRKCGGAIRKDRVDDPCESDGCLHRP